MRGAQEHTAAEAAHGAVKIGGGVGAAAANLTICGPAQCGPHPQRPHTRGDGGPPSCCCWDAGVTPPPHPSRRWSGLHGRSSNAKQCLSKGQLVWLELGESGMRSGSCGLSQNLMSWPSHPLSNAAPRSPPHVRRTTGSLEGMPPQNTIKCDGVPVMQISFVLPQRSCVGPGVVVCGVRGETSPPLGLIACVVFCGAMGGVRGGRSLWRTKRDVPTAQVPNV